MERSHSSCSDANSLTSFNHMEGPHCHCNRPTILTKSWTDENPGRRFFRCDLHGFFTWADKEKPHGWQKLSLLEARDHIRRQKEEIKDLKESLQTVNQEMLSGAVTDSTLVKSELWKKILEEKKKLEAEAIASKQKEKLLH